MNERGMIVKGFSLILDFYGIIFKDTHRIRTRIKRNFIS